MKVSTVVRNMTLAAPIRHILALSIGAGLAPASFAIDYSATAGFDMRTSYNDNLRMTEDDKTEAFEYRATPNLDLGARTESSSANLTSILYFKRFDKKQFNSDDQNVQLKLKHQFENSSMGFDAGVVRDSTVTSELLTSGIIGETAERTELYTATPYWNYVINEKNMLQLTGTYVSRQYRPSGYTSYNQMIGNIDWTHVLNERWKLVLSGTYKDYESEERKFNVPLFGQQSYSTESKDKGAQVGVEYQWSERTQLQLRAGSSINEQRTPIKDPGNICSDPTYLYLKSLGISVGGVCEPLPVEKSRLSTAEVGWTWNTELHQTAVNITKTTQPSSSGYVVDSTQLSAGWNYRITEKDRFNMELSVVRNRGIGDSNTVQNTAISDRDYLSTTLSYRRQLSETWFLNTSYQYNKQRYSEVDFNADSHAVSLGVSYQPQSWHWSR